MLRSYLITAVRNLIRNSIYAAINIVGLAVGIACCFLILLHVQNELSYDTFHDKHDRIFRLYERWHQPNGSSWTRSITGTAPAPRLKEDFPEIEKVVRLFAVRSLVSAAGKKFYEDGVYYVDPEVFEVFSFELSAGDPRTVLDEPYSVVLTESTARKYFGDINPVGKVMEFGEGTNMTVTGIMKDVPPNSHLRFDLLASLSTRTIADPSLYHHWDCPAMTYLLLTDGNSAAALESRLPGFIERYRDEETGRKLSYGLQPLTDIHLDPTAVSLETAEGLSKLLMFAGIAALILLIAVVNFVNLTTAQYAGRVDEVSVRKVLGASAAQLRWQFIGESTLMVLLAVLLATVVAELFLPVFNALVKGNLEIRYLNNPLAVPGLIGFVIVVGLLGGSYPAMTLSRLNPIAVRQATLSSGSRGVALRRALVVAQFAISTGLILATIVIYSQFNFMVNKNLGFETSNLVVIPVERGESERGLTAALKKQLLNVPGVTGVTATSDVPCDRHVYGGLEILLPGMNEVARPARIFADHDYINTMGLALSEGRDFSRLRDSENRLSLIVNEAATRQYGDKIAPGQTVRASDATYPGESGGYQANIIGVVRDFNYLNLSNRIRPAVIQIEPRRAEYLLVRTAAAESGAVIPAVREVFGEVMSHRPFEFFYLADQIDQVYSNEYRYASVFGYSCVLAIFVAMTGLFGLALYSTRTRIKEIGVRKVCGATTSRIAVMLTTEFAALVLLANAIALPIAYYFLHDWLLQYPYRVDLDATVFLGTILVSIGLSMAAVGFQAVRAASCNPVDSLRYE